MKEILSQQILDNKLEHILYFFGMILLALIFKRYISRLVGSIIYRFFRKYSKENRVSHFNDLLAAPIQWLVFLFIISAGVNVLNYPEAWNVHILDTHLRIILTSLLKLTIVLAFTWLLLRFINFFALLLKERADRDESKANHQLIPFVKDSLKVVVVIISAFFILGVIFKINVASLIAGLGIGGLAVALAAQETLKNLFASITIFLDKPFTVGDVVTAGGITGTVERVGFRSTRLRTSSSTYVTLPNKMMVESSLDNQTLRTSRGASINIILSYETSLEQLKSTVKAIAEYLDTLPRMSDNDTVLFNDFNENGFQISITYFTPLMDDASFLKIKAEVNYKVMEIIQKQGVSFAKHAQRVEMMK